MIVTLLLFILPTAGIAQGQEVPGVYEGGELFLGFNSQDQVLTGYFESCTGLDEKTNKPLFCCMFMLYGKKEGSKYKITTWYPGDPKVIKGEFTFGDFKAGTAHIRLKERPPGSMAYNFDTDKGNYLTLDESRPWLEIRMVSALRAYFHRNPDPKSKKAAYVVRHDVVQVLENQDKWVLAEYGRGTGKLTRGWLKEDDLFSRYPPKK